MDLVLLATGVFYSVSVSIYIYGTDQKLANIVITAKLRLVRIVYKCPDYQLKADKKLDEN